MSDQAFPGQPLNDEWLFADPEKLILIQQRTERRKRPNVVIPPRGKYFHRASRRQPHSWGRVFLLGLSAGFMAAYLTGLL